MKQNYNVVLISIDALRPDHLRCYGYHRDTSCEIDNIARLGVLFRNAYTNGIPTFYSFRSIFCSIYPLEGYPCIGLPSNRKTITELLREKGYNTGAFIAANPWLSASYGYGRGFDLFEDYWDEKSRNSSLQGFFGGMQRCVGGYKVLSGVLGRLARLLSILLKNLPSQHAEIVTRDAIRWLRKKGDTRFFLWLHFMEPHYPWLPSKKTLRKLGVDHINAFELGKLWHKVSLGISKDNRISQKARFYVSKEELQRITDLYDAEIKSVEHSIGKFIQEMKTLRIFDKTVLIILSDHGTEFMDHGGIGHGPWKCYEELIRVPLVVWSPNIQHMERKDDVELLDIAPTILDLAGLNEYEGFRGTSLFNRHKKKKNAIITECIFNYSPLDKSVNRHPLLISCKEGKWKLIINQALNKKELYNLDTDPYERIDLYQSHKKGMRLESIVTKHLGFIEKERLRTRISKLKNPNL